MSASGWVSVASGLKRKPTQTCSGPTAATVDGRGKEGGQLTENHREEGKENTLENETKSRCTQKMLTLTAEEQWDGKIIIHRLSLEGSRQFLMSDVATSQEKQSQRKQVWNVIKEDGVMSTVLLTSPR